MSGIRSRRKGADGDREILAHQHRLKASRTWHLAQSPDPSERRCDVTIAARPAQVKITAKGFKALYHALESVEMAFARSDRRPCPAIVGADEFPRLLAESKKERGDYEVKRATTAATKRAICANAQQLA